MEWVKSAEISLFEAGSDYSLYPKLARVEPDTVSLTAFNNLTLRIFLQGASLAAKLRFVSLINSLAETLRPFKTKIFVLEEADKT